MRSSWEVSYNPPELVQQDHGQEGEGGGCAGVYQDRGGVGKIG